jgi:hypothetical protein
MNILQNNANQIVGLNRTGFEITKMVWYQTLIDGEKCVDDVDVFIAGQVIRTKGNCLPDFFEPKFSDDFKRYVMELGGHMREDN